MHASPVSGSAPHTVFSLLPVSLLLVSMCGGCMAVPGRPTVADAEPDLALQRELADWELIAAADSGDSRPASATQVDTIERGVGADEDALSTLVSAELVHVRPSAVLHAVAGSARLDLVLHEALEGDVTLRVHDVPVRTVLARISKQVPLHWQVKESTLHVWGAKPFTRSYAVDYLNLDRTTRSSVGLATRVGTINATGHADAAGANSSQTLLVNEASHQFWASLQADMQGMLGQPTASQPARFTLNRDAGLLTLHAPAAVHQLVSDYLENLNRRARRQVLIEATVLEVTMSDRFEAGIDWQLLADGLHGVSAVQNLSGFPPVNAGNAPRIAAPRGLLSYITQGAAGSLSITLNLLQQFGDVRIVSRPRIIALNNQSSVLKVVDNRVYFTVNVERQRSENKDEVITETQIHTVPVGLVMNVTPHISDAGSIMLNVRPSLSRILGFVNDPNPALAEASVRNSVPEIQVREMESMLRVRSGEQVIIGGLMQDTIDESDQQLPGLASLPLLGRLFSQKRRQRRQSELLVVLRPTVMDDEPLAMLDR